MNRVELRLSSPYAFAAPYVEFELVDAAGRRVATIELQPSDTFGLWLGGLADRDDEFCFRVDGHDDDRDSVERHRFAAGHEQAHEIYVKLH